MPFPVSLFQPVKPPEPVRVFIGTDKDTIIPSRVLAFSITSRSSLPVEIHYMEGPDWNYDPFLCKVGFGTYFSLRRWLIPSRCNYTGRAIYLDADILCLADIVELWSEPDKTFPLIELANVGHYDMLRRRYDPVIWCAFATDSISRKDPWPQTSVMVIDCVKAKDIWCFSPELMFREVRSFQSKDEYHRFMHAIPIQDRIYAISSYWNCLDSYDPGKSKMVHYTSVPQQPWYNPKHKHAKIWQSELARAVSSGFISKELLEQEMDRYRPATKSSCPSGLHPFYHQFLSLSPSPETRAASSASNPETAASSLSRDSSSSVQGIAR